MTNETIPMPYGVSLAGFKAHLITQPLIHHIPVIRTLLLFYTNHEKSRKTKEQVRSTLQSFGIELHEHRIKDIYNLFEVYFAMDHFSQSWGDPIWLNTTAGPGLAVSALSLFALKHNIDLVAYDEVRDRVGLISIEKLNNLQQCRSKHYPTLKAISRGICFANELSEVLTLSKSTVSRQFKIFKELGLIEITGAGNGYSPFNVKLTEWGEKFVEYSDKPSKETQL